MAPKTLLADCRELVVLLNELREEEGTLVTICSQNPDFNGLPNECISVNAWWTEWEDREFRANSLLECMRLALVAKGEGR